MSKKFNWRRLTIILMISGAVLFVGYDIIAYIFGGVNATESDVITDTNAVFSYLGYAIGVCCGHWILNGSKTAGRGQIIALASISSILLIASLICYFNGYNLPPGAMFFGGIAVGRYLWTRVKPDYRLIIE